MEHSAAILARIKEEPPLIHNITNLVVTNFTANGLYAIGAQPVMANAIEEVEQMASQADALILNIGTLTQDQVNAMVLAGKAANEAGTPVIFDPVGVGATAYRNETAKRLLDAVKMTAIRGNTGEIATLAGLSVNVRGVDSDATLDDPADAAKKVANAHQTIVMMTGETDVITDGTRVITCENGHHLQAKVTGTGCLLTSVTGAFIARHTDTFEAVASAAAFYGAAAEQAASTLTTPAPGSFQMAFLDALYQLKGDALTKAVKLTQTEGA
ncbi:hydroxyethylthiazole kinase [Salisediminibacterium selenitireducens]|uniref:Hydroxyethylthiazole kinase n=1 Tax=Bacillus selenitireducens (strain ATCC 700615 / DSM 15326 / MLS10) TaxID=439292 RepID=D6Y0H2_BACIE|nr:hydroxyethylthiazole kinase [Salisediminibacterium selenitireducens]ADH98563.1 Hydroxyethylthiazole kinase [[Bacillus] selenitireducens MLS10]